jgi:hypothetical protein
MRKILAICASAILLTALASAQVVKPLTDSDIKMLRTDVQADKQSIINDTMQFTDAESKAFTPVYREYALGQQKIGDDRQKLIENFAAQYDTLTDAQANDLFKLQMDIETRSTKLRQQFWPRFVKALGAKRAAKFYQVDNRLSLFISAQLTTIIPLLP